MRVFEKHSVFGNKWLRRITTN